MASTISPRLYSLMFAPFLLLCLIWAAPLRAQEKAPLPDYVIAQFGEPPAVPSGPLSAELQSAVQAAFIDSMTESSWAGDQITALRNNRQIERPPSRLDHQRFDALCVSTWGEHLTL